MAVSRDDGFQYLGVIRMNNKQYGTFYQARLTSKLGRKTIGLGSDYINALNIAKIIDDEIKRLIANDLPIDLDTLKAIAENQKERLKAKEEKKLVVIEKDSIASLWDKYVSFHTSTKQWEESYVLTHIQTITNLIANCPTQKLENKQEIVEWLFSDSSRSASTSKARFKLIVAAIDWNSKQGNIPRKWGIEYRDILNSITVETKKRSLIQEDEEIDIFKVTEIYQILEALKNDTYSRYKNRHSQYYLYAYFCWLTGCRPSEAIALKWENVDLVRKRIKFCEGQVLASGSVIKKSGTKTVEVRYFPINGELENLLTSIHHRKGYVFLNERLKPISQQAFRGIWKTLLDEMSIRHRTPYQMRHSMISYHANNDFPIQKLAEIVGNSEKVIIEHYLRLDIERINLPDVLQPTKSILI